MRRLAALLLALGAASSGCGDDGGLDPDTGILDQLSFASTLIFGPVPLKLEVVESLPIQNEGAEVGVLTAVETDARFSSDSYAFAVESSLPLRVPPGSPVPLMFSFRATEPVSEAQTEVTLVFSTGERTRVGLSAGTAEALRVSTRELDFGPVLGGRPAELTLQVTNQLDRPVPVYAQTSGGRARPDILEGIGRFEIDSAVNEDGRLSSGAPLAARGSLDIVVRYVPDPEGETQDRATWRIGACPELEDDCSFLIEMEGEPIPSPIACRRAGEEETVERLSFGNLNPPETADATITCRVEAPVRLVNIGVPLSGTGVDVESDLLDPPPLLLGVENEFTLQVDFDPSLLAPGTDIPEASQITLELRDPANDAPFAPIEIAVSGGHGRPALSVRPEAVDFQRAVTGTRRPDRVVVTNDGPTPFSGEIEIVPDPGTADGEFDSPRNGGTIDIEPGASETIDLEFAPSGPGGAKSAELRLRTTEVSDPRNPDFTLSVPLAGAAEDLGECEILLSASEIDFGRSVARTENRGYLAITNVDADPCIINGIRLGPGTDPELWLVDPPSEARLGRDESLLLEIGYLTDRPREAEDLTAEGTLEVYVSTTPSAYTFPLRGTQSSDALIRAPNILDLRAGDTSCTAYAGEIAILNAGALEETITSITLVGDDAFAFSLDLPGPPPVSIPAFDGRVAFDVQLDPSLAEDVTLAAQVEVAFSGDPEPLVIPILARSETGSRFEERFVQADLAETDVLFVLPYNFDFGDRDTVAVLEAASLTFEDFIEPIRDASVDYRIGFVTSRITPTLCGPGIRSRPLSSSHAGDCGLLANGPVGPQYRDEWKVVDGTELSPSENVVFEEQMQKSQGFAQPFILQTATRALHPELVADWNSEIHRPDALQHVVFLNNQDDASAGPLEYYVEALRYARGYPRRFDTTSSLIAGLPSGECSSAGTGSAAEAPRLHDASARLGGGLPQSVCDANWSAKMAKVGRDATAIRERVQLARAANPSSIEVRVDGAVLPRNDGPEENWAYDVPSRVLTLRDAQALRAGTEIVVSYRPVCAIN